RRPAGHGADDPQEDDAPPAAAPPEASRPRRGRIGGRPAAAAPGGPDLPVRPFRPETAALLHPDPLPRRPLAEPPPFDGRRLRPRRRLRPPRRALPRAAHQALAAPRRRG